MKFTNEDLLPGEELIQSKGCNCIISISEAGLSTFAADSLMWTVGLKGKEALGGKLHLTNYRLIFKSHNLNRLRGTFSIFLPTIDSIENTSRLMTRKIKVCTTKTDSEFVLWGIDKFIKKIEIAKKKFTEQNSADLLNGISGNYDKVADGMDVFGGLEAINETLLAGKGLSDSLKMATNPLHAFGLIYVDEFVNKLEDQ